MHQGVRGRTKKKINMVGGRRDYVDNIRERWKRSSSFL